MIYQFDILRRENRDAEPYHQQIAFETEDPRETVATALQKINSQGDYLDENGTQVGKITWEVGCLQKKCGACAMRINGQPALACDTFLADLKKKQICLEPLEKFPVVRDLATDRSVLFENLKNLKLWIGKVNSAAQNQVLEKIEKGRTERKNQSEKQLEISYEASRCLQCGCCLEACPNFDPKGDFVGAAGFAPYARILNAVSESQKKEYEELYRKHVFAGCGKSLACQKVCPAGIDLDHLMSRSNAVRIWKRESF